jgi:hypothetical protein
VIDLVDFHFLLLGCSYWADRRNQAAPGAPLAISQEDVKKVYHGVNYLGIYYE